MADHNLDDLLTDFQNLAEAEHHGFIESLISRHDNAATIFAALAFFEVCQLYTSSLSTLILIYSGKDKASRSSPAAV